MFKKHQKFCLIFVLIILFSGVILVHRNVFAAGGAFHATCPSGPFSSTYRVDGTVDSGYDQLTCGPGAACTYERTNYEVRDVRYSIDGTPPGGGTINGTASLAEFQVAIDNVCTGPCTFQQSRSTWDTGNINISGLADGAHTIDFTVRFFDGSTGTPTGCNFTKSSATLSVNLSANPSSGTDPLSTDLTATVGGTATGNILYEFDWTNNSSYDASYTQPGTSKTVSHTYTPAGSYTAKVRVTRGGISATDTVTITVNAAPWLAVALTATPSSGNAPLNNVDLTGNVSGTAIGTIVYEFDCTNDGTWEYTSVPTATDPYTIVDLCDYASAGTYTARVRATRGGLTANDTTTITVSAPANNPPNTPTLIAPANNSCVAANPTFQATVSDPDGDDVYAVFSISGYGAGTGSLVSSSGTSSWGPVAISDGGWWWNAWAEDTLLATSSETAYWYFTKDTIAPIASISSPGGTITKTAINVTLTESDATSGIAEGDVDVNINGAGWVNTGLPNGGSTINDFIYTGTAGNTYQFRYRARDNCGNWSAYSTDDPLTIFNFSMSVSPISGSVSPGGSTTATVTATLLAGTTRAVTFSGSSSPALTDGSISFSIASCNPTCNSTMTINTAGSTPVGVYTITITGTAGSISRTTTYTLTVGAVFNFSMSVSPVSGSVSQGGSTTATATATLSSGTTQAVTYSATSSPALTGGSISFSPASCNPTCNSTMTITTAASTPAGIYTITITGTGGSLTRTTTYTLTVNAATCSVVLTATPSSGTAPLNDVDLTGDVSGTATGDISYRFDCTNDGTWEHSSASTSVDPYTIADLCDYASAATYTAKVRTNRGGCIATTTTSIVVGSGFNFSLAVSPVSGSVTQGGSIAPVATATLSSGTTQAVTYSATSSPALTGGSISFSPASCNPTCNSTMTVSTAATTPVGVYTITITGTGGSLTRTTTYTLTVGAATLSVSLTVTPSSGNAPLIGAVLRATVAGTATGTINYTFYCNRSDSGTNVTSPNSHKLDGTNTNPYSAPSTTCDSVYNSLGSYTAKVIAERGSLAAESRVVVTVNNNAPTADTFNTVESNCCDANPSWLFTWIYGDPDGNPETRFDFQIATISSFLERVINRSINVSPPLASGSQNNQQVLVSPSTPPPVGMLGYNIPYWWRVRVWDNQGTNSGWLPQPPLTFTTRSHRCPICDFTWTPTSPIPGEDVQFTNASTCYNNSQSVVPCTSFSWVVNPTTANPSTSSAQNPLIVFNNNGSYAVSLTVTDGSGYQCTTQKTVRISLPLPRWKEI